MLSAFLLAIACLFLAVGAARKVMRRAVAAFIVTHPTVRSVALALTDAELQTLEAEVKKIPALKAELDAAIKRADDAAGKWGQGPEARIKGLEQELTTSKGALAELEKRLGARVDEVRTEFNRPGGRDVRGQTEMDKKALKAFSAFIRKGTMSPDLVPDVEGKTLATNDNANGGFLVPAPMVGRLIEELVQISPIRANSSPVTIGDGDALDLPRDEGSFSQGWVGETDARTATTTSTFAKLRIPLREQYAFPKATQKMLDDAAFDIEGYIARKLAEKFAYAENYAFINGDNVTQPQGMLEATSGVSTVSTGGSGVITTDGLLNLIAALPTPYASRAALFMNRATMFAIRKLKDTVNGRYLWEPGLPQQSATPGSGLTQPNPSTFAGVPIVETPGLPDLGAGTKPIIYTDWRLSYQIVDKSSVGLLRDPYTDKPNVGFYATRRVGGRVVLPTAAKIGLAT